MLEVQYLHSEEKKLKKKTIANTNQLDFDSRQAKKI